MKKYVRYLLVLLMCGSLTGVKAQKTFQVDGINYYLDGSEARVSDNRDYSGSKIIIPNSVLYVGKNYPVTSIADSAFYGNWRLIEVTIPNSVTNIGNYAFHNCSDLTAITIPNSVTTIGEWAFHRCTGLITVTIPNSVTEIGAWAFYDCSSLTTVTIPNSTIGEYAFKGCTGLTTVIIGNSVTKIWDYAFEGCTGLTTVTIPNSVTTIGTSAFEGCTGLQKVIWNARNAEYYDGISNKSLFPNCDQLTDFVFGEEVEHIPAHLCSELTSLKNIVIGNSVKSIGDFAFYNCKSLTTVTIPNSVTEIGAWAFYDCSSLTTVTIPNAVTRIMDSTFSGCTGLTAVTIGNSVKSIGHSAFWDCRSLTTVTIPNSVTKIKDNAFTGCTQMESVTIGEKVESIGQLAFSHCDNLTAVISKAMTPPEIWEETFEDYAMTLHVPAGRKSKYAEAKYWRNFTDIRETTLYKVTANATDETMGYVMGGGEYPQGSTATLIAVPFGQNYFVRWNDGNTDNPRTITVTGDMTFTAEFAPAGSAVETLENGERGIYATGRTLHVENGGESYRVYTAAGRLVYTGNDSSVTLSAPGMYIVRTSDRSQKVAVK